MSLLWIVRYQHLLLLLALHLVTSLGLIYFRKNKLSYISEVLLIAAVWWYNAPMFKPEIVLSYLAEYILAKLLLVLIVYLAKHFAFYVLVVITHKQKHKY